MRTSHRHRLPDNHRPGGRRPSKAIIALVVLGSLTVCAHPAAAGPIDVIRDCSEDGTLERSYSQRELSGALDTLPSDLDEYTDCRGVIRGAQLSGARGDGPAAQKHAKAGESQGRAARREPTPHETRRIDTSARSRDPVEVGGRLIKPGESGIALGQSGFGGDVPDLLLVTLLGLGAATLWAAGFALQRRRPDARRGAGATLAAPARRIGDGVRRGIARFRR